MITLYTSNNRSSRNAKNYFIQRQIPVQQIKLQSGLTQKDIYFILKNNPDDILSILALKSKGIDELLDQLDKLTLSELVQILISHPEYLKTPIIMDQRHFAVGFNQDGLRMFNNKRQELNV